MKIYAPVKDANGIYASVRFVNGVGETDNPKLINWFLNHGYKGEKSAVEQVNTPLTVDNTQLKSIEKSDNTQVKSVEKSNKPDLDSMTSDEIRTWAKANGYGGIIRNTRDKAKLINLIRG